MKTLVVAHYNEDLDWLPKYREDLQITVYSKSYRPPDFSIALPNVGREAHTYLSHIVEHYDDLHGDYVFCQGNPFDHCPSFLEDLENPAITSYGMIEDCDESGQPRYSLGLMPQFCDVFGLPKQPSYRFAGGAQYRVSTDQIKSRSLAFYTALLAASELNDWHAYTLERLWPLIWELNYEETHR